MRADVKPLLGFGHRAADDHVLDLLGSSAFGLRSTAALIAAAAISSGRTVAQTAAMGLADRRARAADDDCFSHCNSPRSKVEGHRTANRARVHDLMDCGQPC